MSLTESPLERQPSVTSDTLDKPARLRSGTDQGLEAGGKLPERAQLDPARFGSKRSNGFDPGTKPSTVYSCLPRGPGRVSPHLRGPTRNRTNTSVVAPFGSWPTRKQSGGPRQNSPLPCFPSRFFQASRALEAAIAGHDADHRPSEPPARSHQSPTSYSVARRCADRARRQADDGGTETARTQCAKAASRNFPCGERSIWRPPTAMT